MGEINKIKKLIHKEINKTNEYTHQWINEERKIILNE